MVRELQPIHWFSEMVFVGIDPKSYMYRNWSAKRRMDLGFECGMYK